MRLGVRVGQGCARLLDEKMRGLDCNRIELDEVWRYISKKMAHVREDDDPTMGDVWTFCAIDAQTKLVPAFKVASKRNIPTTIEFKPRPFDFYEFSKRGGGGGGVLLRSRPFTAKAAKGLLKRKRQKPATT